MEVHRFYTYAPVKYKTKNAIDDTIENKYTLYVKRVHSAYIYPQTYFIYYDNLFALWNTLSDNDGEKLETIEDHYEETTIVYFDKYSNTFFESEYNTDLDNMYIISYYENNKITHIYWE